MAQSFERDGSLCAVSQDFLLAPAMPLSGSGVTDHSDSDHMVL